MNNILLCCHTFLYSWCCIFCCCFWSAVRSCPNMTRTFGQTTRQFCQPQCSAENDVLVPDPCYQSRIWQNFWVCLICSLIPADVRTNCKKICHEGSILYISITNWYKKLHLQHTFYLFFLFVFRTDCKEGLVSKPLVFWQEKGIFDCFLWFSYVLINNINNSLSDSSFLSFCCFLQVFFGHFCLEKHPKLTWSLSSLPFFFASFKSKEIKNLNHIYINFPSCRISGTF